MCIIIAKPAGVKRLDPAYFVRAWDRNPDGGGLVWKEKDGEVTMQKGFMKKEEFLKKIDELNQDDTAFIAHFRIKSVGAVCAENTHPFVMDHVTYAHNGTLSIEPFEGKTDSETFGLAFLKDKPMSWIKDYQVLLEMALGTSKFAIMDNKTGEIFILNQDCGEEQDGAWFSNKSAFEVKTSPYLGYYKGYGVSSGYDYNHALNETKVKGRSDFGTKRFRREYAYVGDGGVWRYSSTKAPVCLPGLAKCTLHKRGFWVINPEIGVPEEAQDKTYNKNDPEVRLTEAMTKELYKTVGKYHGATFDDLTERDDAEMELSAMYTVIRAMFAFIRAKKVIDDNEFLSFLLDNTESDSWVTKACPQYSYTEYVRLYAEEVLDRLEKGEAKA